MERLIETGRIGGYELRAAQEIERVFYFIAGGLLSRTMRYDERTDPSSSNDVPEWFLSAYHKRYKPFADDPKSGFQICIEVLRRWPQRTHHRHRAQVAAWLRGKFTCKRASFSCACG